MGDSIVAALALEQADPTRYRVADHVAPSPGVVFGGQLLAQSLVAAQTTQTGPTGPADKLVKTIHTVFARAASTSAPIELLVEPAHGGRTFASSTVTVTQDDRLCTRSLVLLSAEEPDLIRHADAAPDVAGPESATPLSHGGDDWEIRVVGNVDVSDPASVGPPDLDVWSRFPNAPDDPATGQALLGYASDGFLIGTAMRPHEGVGQAHAHVTLSTGVVSHTLTFHEPFSAREWLLLSHHATYAGHGRCYGRANVFDAAGVLVASFVQDGMIRPLEQSGTKPKL
jgi:acyl-CoA thioesterase